MGRQALSGRNWGRLRRENHRLRQERDILAKAAAWFARGEQGEPERGLPVHDARTRPCIPFAPWPEVLEGFCLGLLRLAEPTSFGSGDR